MIKDDKLEKMCNEFLLLNNQQQDYILGILQALVFAKNTGKDTENDNNYTNSGEAEPVPGNGFAEVLARI